MLYCNKTKPIMKGFLYFLIIINSLNIATSDDAEIVDDTEIEIKQGVLLGKVKKTFLKEHSYYAFRGIPYAVPPLGPLRFKPPVQHQGWEGTYKAYNKKPSCYQYSARSRVDEFTIYGSEDCLYVSVFSPNIKGSAAVLVFEYNDDFRSGYNDTDVYSPDFFIEQDIVVVYINHRLGIFGYLTTDDNVIPPNAGLKDFIMGLKWVKDNIDKFGGDSKRVTLMGNSGGAVLTDILLYSEKAVGLFEGAIIQSGTALQSIFFDKAPREKAFKLTKALKIETNDSQLLLDELQKMDAKTLISKDGEAVDHTLFDNYQLAVFPFSPTIEKSGDDAVLTSLPENGKIVNDVPIIIGMNSREGLDLVSHYISEPRLVEETGQEFFMIFPMRTQFSFDRKSAIYNEAIREVLDFYFEEGYFYYANILEYAVYTADIMVNYALNLAARKLATSLQSSVYYYMFDFRGLLNENSEYMALRARLPMEHWGATVGDELCYLQLCQRIKKTYKSLNELPSEQQEIKVLKKMVRLWTNFIKTKNPTPDDDTVLNGFHWEPIQKDSEDIAYLHITKTLKMKANPLDKREKFWDDFLAKYSKLTIDGVVHKKENKHEEL